MSFSIRVILQSVVICLVSPHHIEAATNLNGPLRGTPIFTTNPVVLPFEFTDFDVRIAAYPQKFYRVRQP